MTDDREALTAELRPLIGAHADVVANHLAAAGFRRPATGDTLSDTEVSDLRNVSRKHRILSSRGAGPFERDLFAAVLHILADRRDQWQAAADHPQDSCEDCGHASGCATHNAPALPAGPCDCGGGSDDKRYIRWLRGRNSALTIQAHDRRTGEADLRADRDGTACDDPEDHDQPTAPDTRQREALAEWLGDLPESRNVFDHTGEATTVLTIDVERLADLLLTRLPRDTGDSETTVEWGTRYATGEVRFHGSSETYSKPDAYREVERVTHNARELGWSQDLVPAVVVRREWTRTPDRVTAWQEVPADD